MTNAVDVSCINVAPVLANFRVFTRLFGLETDQLYRKYSSDEFDAFSALDCIKILLKDTSRFIGRQKHAGVPFDFVDDVKQDMAEMLLLDEDAAVTAVKRKRHLPLFYLVVDPVMNVFKELEHQQAIDNVDSIIEHIKNSVFNEEDYGTYDDALVAREQARRVVREREELIKTQAAAKRKKGRKNAKVIEAEVEAVADAEVE